MFEPVIAIAASSRDWPRRVYEQVVGHGGARIRGMLLDRDAVVRGSFDVLVVDDTASFLDQRLVRHLHDHRRRVLGVYEEAWGRERLGRLGVDLVIRRDAPVGEFLAAVTRLSRHTDPGWLPGKTVRTPRWKSTPRVGLRWYGPRIDARAARRRERRSATDATLGASPLQTKGLDRRA